MGAAEIDALTDADLVDTLEEQGLVAAAHNRRRFEVRLHHPLYGDALRRRMPASRVRKLSRSLADVVESSGARRREDTLRVASWRLTGGGGDAETLLEGAATARWHYHFALAGRLVRAALDAGAGFDAALLDAEIDSLQGRDPSAKLAELAELAEDDARRVAVALVQFDYFYHQPRHRDALVLTETAESSISDQRWRDVLTARRLWATMVTRGPRAGADTARPLLRRLDGRALVDACMAAAYSNGRLGRLDDALEIAALGWERHRHLDTQLEWYPWIHLWNRCEVLVSAGRFAEAESLAIEQYREAVDDHSTEAQMSFAMHLCRSMVEQGRVATAVRYGRTAVALAREHNRPLFLKGSLAYLALALALGANEEAAGQALDELDALGEPTYYVECDVLQARAWLSACSGDIAAARRTLDHAIRLGTEIGDVIGQIGAMHGLARLGRPDLVAYDLRTLADDVDADLSRARSRHADALVAQDPHALRDVSAAFAALGARLLAAEAAFDEAAAWRRSSDRRARSAALHAEHLASDCESAWTPTFMPVDARTQLTEGERETAALAAEGLSNKDIARQLGLSVRTVGNRLYRVYQKLGVQSRADLPDIWRQRRPPNEST